MKRIIIITSLLLAMLPAQAQSRSCPSSYPIRIPHGCAKPPGVSTGARCDSGYYGQFNRTSAGWSVRCVPGPEVQR